MDDTTYELSDDELEAVAGGVQGCPLPWGTGPARRILAATTAERDDTVVAIRSVNATN